MKTVRLGDICDIVSGGTPSRSKTEFWQDGTIPWIKIGNIKGKYVSEADEFITQAGLDGSSAKMLSKGTILYTIFATLGEVGILNIDACTNQAIAGISIRESSIIQPDYLYYYLKSKKSYVNGIGRGVAQNNINMSILRDYRVPLPKIEQQNEIVSVLDRASSVMSLHQKQLSVLDDLIKARFVEMFGNCASNGISLRECCLDVRGGGTPSMQHPEYYGGEVPFIKSGDVRGDMVSSGALWLTEQALAETTAKFVPKGSVLVVNRSAALLREFRAAIAVQPVVINQDIKAFIPKPEFTSEYLLWAIKIQTQFLLTKVTTVLTSHIDLKDLLELRIVPASIERQIAFSTFIAQVDKSKFVVQQALEKAQLLFDSLMQKYYG